MDHFNVLCVLYVLTELPDSIIAIYHDDLRTRLVVGKGGVDPPTSYDGTAESVKDMNTTICPDAKSSHLPVPSPLSPAMQRRNCLVSVCGKRLVEG